MKSVPMKRCAIAMVLACALAACGTTGGTRSDPFPPQPTDPSSIPGSLPQPPQTQTREGLTPPFLAGRELTRVGVLLPFSSRPDQALAMFQAAELAIFDQGNADTLLIPRDSGATEQTAEEAAALLLRAGADIIIGPLARDQVRGAHRGVGSRAPVIGFSNDRTVAGNGAYLLSIPPEEEVARIVEFASRRNLRSFALLAPTSELGRRVETAMRREVAARGGTLTLVQTYANSTERDAAAAARTLATQLRSQPVQAILIAESGAALRATGPALLAGGLDLSRIQLLGIGGWATGDALREPTLARGWYVAPDPALRKDFEDRYRAAYGQAPSRLASLAYDGVAMSAYLTRDRGAGGINRSALERDTGFAGADGLFRFRGDGTAERALAVLEVRQTGAVTIDAAPRRFTSSGF